MLAVRRTISRANASWRRSPASAMALPPASVICLTTALAPASSRSTTRDGGAFLRETKRAGAAHAGCGRGDDADLVGETHGRFLSALRL